MGIKCGNTIVGWDIGGANIKATLIQFSEGKIVESTSELRYFPLWIEGKVKLPQVLRQMKQELAKGRKIDGVAVTMTAELSDVYYSKREGVNHVLDSVIEAFSEKGCLIRVVDVEGKLRNVEEARAEPLKVAAANWPATAWLVSQHFRNTILIDTGSTTTDIVPIREGRIVAAGKTDPERLASGELIFTGALRTPVPAITNTLTYKNRPCRVSSEKFALSADVHLVLGHITEEEYTCDSADGRPKTYRDCLARLARVICADIEMLSEPEILKLAQEICDAQVNSISQGIAQVAERLRNRYHESLARYPITVAGLGREFLAAEAAKRLKCKKIVNLEDTLGKRSAIVAPSAAAAIMLNEYILSSKANSLRRLQ